MSIIEDLKEDLDSAKGELAASESRCTQLRWQVDYLEKLVKKWSGNVPADPTPKPATNGHGLSIFRAGVMALEQSDAPLQLQGVVNWIVEKHILPPPSDREQFARNLSSSLNKASKNPTTGVRKVGRGMFTVDKPGNQMVEREAVSMKAAG